MSIFDRLFKRGKGKAPAAPRPKPELVVTPAGGGRPAASPVADNRTPEERCGISPEMSEDEIRERLAKLFRRHNHLASSLDAEARREADYMLDLLVQMREKHLS